MLHVLVPGTWLQPTTDIIIHVFCVCVCLGTDPLQIPRHNLYFTLMVGFLVVVFFCMCKTNKSGFYFHSPTGHSIVSTHKEPLPSDSTMSYNIL